MKPELIFVTVKDDMVVMSMENLQGLIDRTYEAGKNDASPLQMPLSYPYVVNPTTGEINAWMNTNTVRGAEGTGTTTATTLNVLYDESGQ